MPNRLESSVGILNCKFENAPHEQTHFHVETEQAPDKPIWQYSPFQSFVNSNFGSLEDIVLINIDISSTLVVTALYEQGVSLFYPYGKTQFKEIRLILKTESLELTKGSRFINIYDGELSKQSEVEFIVFSKENNALYWLSLDHPMMGNLKWTCNFWFYLIVYIITACMVLGIIHFVYLDTSVISVLSEHESILNDEDIQMDLP